LASTAPIEVLVMAVLIWIILFVALAVRAFVRRREGRRWHRAGLEAADQRPGPPKYL
jgi:hypothetical protein